LAGEYYNARPDPIGSAIGSGSIGSGSDKAPELSDLIENHGSEPRHAAGGRGGRDTRWTGQRDTDGVEGGGRGQLAPGQ
jgi:hypothetical protein